jgi:hypothetical protein
MVPNSGRWPKPRELRFFLWQSIGTLEEDRHHALLLKAVTNNMEIDDTSPVNRNND